MPPSIYAARREAMIAWMIERMEAGEDLHRLCGRAQAPCCYATVMKWQAADPALKQRFAQARRWGRGVRFEGSHPDRWRIDPVKANELLARVAAGEALKRLTLKCVFIERPAFRGWKRACPDFAQRLEAAKAAGRKARLQRLRERPPPWPWDEAVSDQIVLRVTKGERLRDVCRDPAMPSRTAVERWRREQPDFSAALRSAMRVGWRRRRAARGLYTPEMAQAVCQRIADGAAMVDLRDEPDMPHDSTVREWMRRDLDFADRVASARGWRDDLLADEAMAIAFAATRETLAVAKHEISRIRRRIAATQPKPRRGPDAEG